MAGYRFRLDLFIPEAVFNSIANTKKIAFRDLVRELKSKAIKLNEGLDNEEVTIRAVWHRCYHDESPNKPCEPEQEI